MRCVFEDTVFPDLTVENAPGVIAGGVSRYDEQSSVGQPRRNRYFYVCALLAGGGLVLGNDIGRDATAILNVDPVLACPVPDFGRVLG